MQTLTLRRKIENGDDSRETEIYKLNNIKESTNHTRDFFLAKQKLSVEYNTSQKQQDGAEMRLFYA